MRNLSPFRTDIPYSLSILLLSALSILPSLLMVLAASSLLSALGVDVSASAQEVASSLRPDSPSFLIGAVVIFPFIETLLLIGGIKLLGLVVASSRLRSVLSGLTWGVLHGLVAPLWFVGTFWSFFVFSSAYQSWRRVGRWRGVGAAWLPHAIQNGVAMILVGA